MRKVSKQSAVHTLTPAALAAVVGGTHPHHHDTYEIEQVKVTFEKIVFTHKEGTTGDDSWTGK